MINNYGLLKSFDSSNVDIVDRSVKDDKKCTLYSNGKVIFIQNTIQKILHIDLSLCTSFGFVYSLDNEIRIYTCSKGIVYIYLIEKNDILKISLQNSTYHVKNNSVKYFDDTYYLISGVQVEISSKTIIDKIKRKEIETIYINDTEYAIINSTLVYSTSVNADSFYNTGRSFVNYPLIGNYNVFDYSINSDKIILMCRDGNVVYLVNNNLMKSFQLSYYPNLDIKMTNPLLSAKISDYSTLKMTDNPVDINSKNKDLKMRFFTNCPDGSIRYCDIFEDNTAIIHYSNNEFNSNKTPIVISNVSCDYDDTTFNNPDRVSFSSDGSKVIIVRGKNGLIFVDDKSYRYICKDYGFRENCEVTSAIFADDGFLYIALKNKGYVLRNVTKNQYVNFFDIVTSSMTVEDGRLDINTRVSNIVSTENGIFFYCQGSHELESDPGVYIVNSGFYYYNSTNTKLVKIETLDLNFTISNRRLFSVNEYILIHENDFIISKMNIFDFTKEYLILDQISGCKVWDIFEYNQNIIFHISSPIDINNYSSSIISYSDNMIKKTIQLGVVNSQTNIAELNIDNNFLPFISFCQIYNNTSIIIFKNNNSIITLYSIDNNSGDYIKRIIDIPILLSNNSKIIVDNFDKYIDFRLSSSINKCENDMFWRYYIEDNVLKEINNKSFYNYEKEIDDLIICKSLSTTNLSVSEGFISGNNCLSDFGAFNVRYNPDTLKSTRSFYTTSQINSAVDLYFDRITNEQVQIQSICKIKENYTFIMPIGIGRDDCKVYLAFDPTGAIRCIWEYSTNNNDIVDIFVKGSSSNINDISGFEFLGEATPGSTKFNNVDRWYIGDINNSVVGFIFARDINDVKTKFIETIIFIGVKIKYIFQPTELINVEIPNFVQILDDTQSVFKMYCQEFGQKYISVKNGECIFVDIFSRQNPELFINKKITTILDKNFDINSDFYFKSKSSINNNSIAYIHDTLLPIIQPNKRLINDNIEIVSDDDDYYICSMIKSNVSTKIDFLNFNIEDDGVSDVVIYIEFDPSYGNIKDNSIIKSLLFGIKFSYKIGLTDHYDQINFIKDSNNDNIYYANLNMASKDYSSCKICLDSQNVNTNNTRFRIWSNTIFDDIISRNSIGPSASCQDVDILLDTPVEGYFYNSIRVVKNDSLIPKTINKNILQYKDNSLLQMKLLPNYNGWMICDIFDILSIDIYTLSLQISSLSSNSMDVNCKIYGSSIPESSFTLDKDIPINFKVKFENNTISIKLIQDTNEIIICTDLILTNIIEDYSILDFFFGEIQNISLVEDVLDYSSIDEIVEIGDNVFGQVVSMIRDYETGVLHALVSPSSLGIIKNKGILEYEILENSCNFVRYQTDKIFNDLKYGEFGFCENSVFILLCIKNKNNDFINIFKRKIKVQTIDEFESDYIVGIDNSYIVDLNGNKIKTCETKI